MGGTVRQHAPATKGTARVEGGDGGGGCVPVRDDDEIVTVHSRSLLKNTDLPWRAAGFVLDVRVRMKVHQAHCGVVMTCSVGKQWGRGKSPTSDATMTEALDVLPPSPRMVTLPSEVWTGTTTLAKQLSSNTQCMPHRPARPCAAAYCPRHPLRSRPPCLAAPTTRSSPSDHQALRCAAVSRRCHPGFDGPRTHTV